MMRLEGRIKNYWEGEAQGYSNSIQAELNGPKRDAWKQLILKNAPQDRMQLQILDVGTGPGFFPIILGEEGHLVTGIDLTENMLECARRNAKDNFVTVNFRQMNCQKLDFPDNTFDLLLCRNLTWILEKPEQAYKEWRRVLKPGGRLLIFDANWNHYLFDEDTRRRHEKREQEIREKYGAAIHDHADMEESDAISRQLPMGLYQRPVWDLNALLEAGFSKVFAQADISKDIPFSERELASYQDTLQFMVGAEKE